MAAAAHDLPQGLVLVLGGAASGKSAHAEALVATCAPERLYIATAEAGDAEMQARIRRHQARRGQGWQLREVPVELAEALRAAPAGMPVLIDCLTLWLSNLMAAGEDPAARTAALIAAARAHDAPVVMVSNELGLGLVPESALGRAFREAHGRMNAAVAAAASRVDLVVAGIALRIKPRSEPA